MSIKNEDRHGLAHLQHDDVKILDKLHVPPWLIFAIVAFPLGVILYQGVGLQDQDIATL